MTTNRTPTARLCSGDRGRQTGNFLHPQSTTLRQVIHNAQGRVIGTVVNDTFIKSVRGSVHMLKVPRGWACDVCALKEAERLGAKWLVIVDDETETRYRAALATFLRDGIPVEQGLWCAIGAPARAVADDPAR